MSQRVQNSLTFGMPASVAALYEPNQLQQSITLFPSTKGTRKRSVYTMEQIAILEKEYMMDNYTGYERRCYLSCQLGLSEYQIKVWFQNKRAKKKKTTLLPCRNYKKRGRAHKRSSDEEKCVKAIPLMSTGITKAASNSNPHEMVVTDYACVPLKVPPAGDQILNPSCQNMANKTQASHSHVSPQSFTNMYFGYAPRNYGYAPHCGYFQYGYAYPEYGYQIPFQHHDYTTNNQATYPHPGYFPPDTFPQNTIASKAVDRMLVNTESDGTSIITL